MLYSSFQRTKPKEVYMGDYKHKVSVTLVLDSPYDEKFSNLPFEEVVETLTSKYNDLLKKLHCEDHVVYFETDRPCAYQNGWYYNVGNAQCYFSTDSVTVNIPINVDYLLSVL